MTRGLFATILERADTAEAIGLNQRASALLDHYYVWQGNRLVHWFHWSEGPGGFRRFSASRLCAQQR